MNNELELLRKIETLEKEIKKIKGEDEEKIPTYQYNKMKYIDFSIFKVLCYA